MLLHRPQVPKVVEHFSRLGFSKANAWLAVKITQAVGTMTCAWIFTVIALLGLPAALKPDGEGIIAWVAQTFIQLVLLSIIMVGQRVQGLAADQRADATYHDTEEILRRLDAVMKTQLATEQELLAAINLVTSRTAADKKPKR
jgi:hypothetical protein